MELFLSQNQRLTHDTLEQFAHEQNLTISAVRNWVNNRKQRMKRGSTGFEESPGKYPRVDDSDELDNGSFQTRSEHYEASGFHEIETEQVPTMVSSAPYDQNRVAQRINTQFDATRVTTELDTPSFNGVGTTSVDDVPTMATSFKQENDEQEPCERNGPTNVTVECLSPE